MCYGMGCKDESNSGHCKCTTGRRACEFPYSCGNCGELYKDEQAAVDCCYASEKVTAWTCSICDELYMDKLDADSCCVLHKTGG
jgi:hypothetical protein